MKVAARHDGIADIIVQLALSVRRMEAELDNLDVEATKLQSDWHGEAQHAYARAHDEWSTAIHTMKAVLAEATRRLTSANATSMETAATATRIWA